MEQPTTRKIIHIDMDAFYASVEQRDNITLTDLAAADKVRKSLLKTTTKP